MESQGHPWRASTCRRRTPAIWSESLKDRQIGVDGRLEGRRPPLRRWFGPVLAMILMLLLLSAVPTPAGAEGTQFVHVKFVDQARMVTLTIPTPACKHSAHAAPCVWELFVDEPDVPGQPVFGAVSGTSGVLSVPYPTLCGVLQADALVGSPPRKAVGYRHVINACGCGGN